MVIMSLKYTKNQLKYNFFLVNSMNYLLESSENKSVFGDLDILDVKETRQYMYRLSLEQAAEKQNSRTNNLGKLDILWRSNMGTKGQIQSSPLVRQVIFLFQIIYNNFETKRLFYIDSKVFVYIVNFDFILIKIIKSSKLL